MKSLLSLKEADLKGKRVFLRVALTVPLDENSKITDDARTRAVVRTIKYLMGNGAKVILASHLGCPIGVNLEYSLKLLVPGLSELLGVEVKMADHCIGEEVQKLAATLPNGGVLLLENLSFYREEMMTDPEFTTKFAALADLYCIDVSGRTHIVGASTEGVAKYSKSAMQQLLGSPIGPMANPQKPIDAIVGGLQVSTKIGMIESLLENISLLDGGTTFTSPKAQDDTVGSSLVEHREFNLAMSLIFKGLASLILPNDVVAPDKFDADTNSKVLGSPIGHMANPQKPFDAIVGGSKVSSKIGMIESPLENISLLDGGITFTSPKAQDDSVGSSLEERYKLNHAISLIFKAKAKEFSLMLHNDLVASDKFDADANSKDEQVNGLTVLDPSPVDFDINSLQKGVSLMLHNDFVAPDKFDADANSKVLGSLIGPMANPQKPFDAIVGGSKGSIKIDVIDPLLENIPSLDGGMSFTSHKAQGHPVGSSLEERDKLNLAVSLIQKDKAKGVSLIFPIDIVAPDMFDADANSKLIKKGDLEELREVGSGTFGVVYHGKWRGEDVAIKRIKMSCFSGQSSKQERLRIEFWQEADILSKLHHPNVVAFYGVVQDGPGGAPTIVTEYMVDGSLRHVLHRKDRHLDHWKRLIIAMDAASGMEYLHSENVVHFDLKSDNLLVNLEDPSRPICKVGDFGLSKIKRNTLVSGGFRGTLPWMAPELLDGSSNKVSDKVDVFSFGIVLWEILTGEEPYADMHYGAILGGILNNTLRPPIPSSCDTKWRKLMEECWAQNPVDRPSFMEIAGRLRAMLAAAASATSALAAAA